jgi:hypothetical protein
MTLAALLMTMIPTLAAAATNHGWGTPIAENMEMSGYADVQHVTWENTPETNDPFRVGQAELGFSSTLSPQVGMDATIAYWNEDLYLNRFAVDFHLWGPANDHYWNAPNLESSGIQVGRFDVPFGVDWQVYDSINRRLVSKPLAVERTHSTWNDYGVNLYFNTSWWNLKVFGLNGFGYETAFEDGTGAILGFNGIGYDPASRNGYDVVEFDTNLAVGGRVGIVTTPWLELGGSYSGFFNQDNEIDMSLMGADLQFDWNEWEIKGEYIVHELGSTFDDSEQAFGYYGQGIYHWDDYYFVGRYGTFDSGHEGMDAETRMSVGAGWWLLSNVSLRAEYQSNNETDDLTAVQVAVGF